MVRIGDGKRVCVRGLSVFKRRLHRELTADHGRFLSNKSDEGEGAGGQRRAEVLKRVRESGELLICELSCRTEFSQRRHQRKKKKGERLIETEVSRIFRFVPLSLSRPEPGTMLTENIR